RHGWLARTVFISFPPHPLRSKLIVIGLKQEVIMFREKIELKDLEKMDAEYRELLGRVITIQADCEIGGPHLYVKDILPSAPSKANQLIVARTAAEEMDHYRKIARLAGEIGIDVSFLLSTPNQERQLEAFRGIIKTWEDFA